ncbi:hypothetical protein J6590_058304 [Homalodisca vitripennis]|nr:hypothetical protein J6590_058304 [Homalodisca vitripennis]
MYETRLLLDPICVDRLYGHAYKCQEFDSVHGTRRDRIHHRYHTHPCNSNSSVVSGSQGEYSVRAEQVCQVDFVIVITTL